MRVISHLLTFSIITGTFRASNANGLTISTPVVSGSNIVFDITWENSWFTTLGTGNYDAVWIFVKRQNCTNNLWVHAPVNTSSGAHSVTGGVLQVDAVTDGMGVFVRRFAVGAGTVPTATVTLALQTPANGVDNFQVHGLEMVNIPQGDFRLGSGLGSNNTNCNFGQFTVTSAVQTSGLAGAAISGPCGSGSYIQSVPATFPLGWNRFYAMKHEVSQSNYAAFLNTLTYTQQTARMTALPNAAIGTPVFGTPIFRNGLEIMTPGTVSNIPAVIGHDLNNNNIFNENGDGQFISCNFLSWQDLMAYLDWAALRPMTEFEFEKMCRGGDPYPAGFVEYAWGNTNLIAAQSSALNNAGSNNETSTAFGPGLCAYNGGAAAGPLRGGFAAGLTSRSEAGAGIFGNLDLSGNVWEQCVGGSCSNTGAASFTTANGNGNLNTAGFCDLTTWPFNGGNCQPNCLRGGSWASNSGTLRLSDRTGRSSTSNNRVNDVGGRGVRSF